MRRSWRRRAGSAHSRRTWSRPVGTRVAVNTSPEPASNIAVSAAEDLTVAAVIATAFANPWIAAVIAGVLLVFGATVVVFVLRRLGRVRARYRAWSEPRGSAAPAPISESAEPPPRVAGRTGLTHVPRECLPVAMPFARRVVTDREHVATRHADAMRRHVAATSRGRTQVR